MEAGGLASSSLGACCCLSMGMAFNTLVHDAWLLGPGNLVILAPDTHCLKPNSWHLVQVRNGTKSVVHDLSEIRVSVAQTRAIRALLNQLDGDDDDAVLLFDFLEDARTADVDVEELAAFSPGRCS